MATYSSTPAWKGQRSLASYSLWGHKRVGHNLATKQWQQRTMTTKSQTRLEHGLAHWSDLAHKHSNWVLVLYIFWIQVLCQMYNCQIFSFSLTCLFILLTVSFKKQIFFLISKFKLFFFFTGHVFNGKSKKSLNPRLQTFSPMLSYKSVLFVFIHF